MVHEREEEIETTPSHRCSIMRWCKRRMRAWCRGKQTGFLAAIEVMIDEGGLDASRFT